MNINQIKPNPENPRIIKDEKFKKLVQSIKDFPEMLNLRPVIVNEDMIVLGGNMRLKACKEAGLKEVPIIIATNLSEEKQREFVIKDNLGSGEWDWDNLANEWDDLNLKEWGIIQWDIPNYNPILNPSTNYEAVTEENVDKVTKELNERMGEMNTQDDLIEVICPKCANEFFIMKTK
jgi:ParB-like chromosome segregation protein Spo0J